MPLFFNLPGRGDQRCHICKQQILQIYPYAIQALQMTEHPKAEESSRGDEARIQSFETGSYGVWYQNEFADVQQQTAIEPKLYPNFVWA